MANVRSTIESGGSTLLYRSLINAVVFVCAVFESTHATPTLTEMMVLMVLMVLMVAVLSALSTSKHSGAAGRRKQETCCTNFSVVERIT